MKRELVAIVGPTGSGKSGLALQLASRLDGEIVGCDALQVYRGLDVGTAKPTVTERRRIPHHLIDFVSPREEFSAADYISHAVPAIRNIAAAGRLPLVVGGTGLYLRALRRGLFEGPGRSPEIRELLARIGDRKGSGYLHRMLRRVDRRSAERVHPNDRIRLVRALEVFIQSRRPMSSLMAARRSPLPEFHVILIGLAPSRDVLRARIEARVARMFDQGLVDEVKKLKNDYGEDVPAFKAIGYRETLRYLSGELDEERARQLIALASIQYAKRQMTWFRREENIEWFDGYGEDPSVVEAVATYLRPQQELETLHAETAS